MRIKQKWNTQLVKQYVEDHSECILLSEYFGFMNKLTMQCKCGNIFERTFHSFKQNVRNNGKNECPKCGKETQRKQMEYPEEKLEKYFENYSNAGFLWKDKNTGLLLFVCKCGKFIRKTFRQASGKPNLQCEECARKQKWKTNHYKSENRIISYLERNNILEYRILKRKNLHYTKIEMPCLECGEWFTSTFNYVVRLHGRRCNKCIMKDIIQKTNLDFDNVIEKAQIYNIRLITKKEEYVNVHSPIFIICNKHSGDIIKTTWAEMKYFHPCKKCKCGSSTLEAIAMNVLENENIYYEPHVTEPECKYKQSLQFDFVIYSNNEKTIPIGVIETHGVQHERPVQFGGMPIERAEELFEEQKIKDQIKRDYCKNKNIGLLELWYNETDKYEDLIKEFIQNSTERKSA